MGEHSNNQMKWTGHFPYHLRVWCCVCIINSFCTLLNWPIVSLLILFILFSMFFVLILITILCMNEWISLFSIFYINEKKTRWLREKPSHGAYPAGNTYFNNYITFFLLYDWLCHWCFTGSPSYNFGYYSYISIWPYYIVIHLPMAVYSKLFASNKPHDHIIIRYFNCHHEIKP